MTTGFIAMLVTTGCGMGGAVAKSVRAPSSAALASGDAVAAEAAPSSARSENGYSDVNVDRTLNTDSYVRTWTDELLATASEFRREIYRQGGAVLAERIDYEDELRVSSSRLARRAPKRERQQAVFELSLPIENLPALLDWLRIETLIIEQYVSSHRDGKLPTTTVVATEKQLQNQIEQRLAAIALELAQADTDQRMRLEAERRALLDNLARSQAATQVPDIRMATLTVQLESDQPQVRFATARLLPTVRSTLFVTDALGQSDSRDVRVGAAIGVAIPWEGEGGVTPSPIIEIAGYAATDDKNAGLTVTTGTAIYARSLGDGKRTILNPFAGMRFGYAYFDAHSFTIAGELGVELFKAGGIAWSASVRPSGLIGKDPQFGVEAGSNLMFAF